MDEGNAIVAGDLLIRDGLIPGPGRPLRADPKGFWYIDDRYPSLAKAKGEGGK